MEQLNEKIDSLITLCNQKFAQFDEKLSLIDERHQQIEKIIHKIDNCGIQATSMSLMPNFSKIENKVDYLNQNIQNVISCDICQFIREKAREYMSHQHVYDILQSAYDVYQFISDVIQHIASDIDNPKFIYAFPFQKSVIYFWDSDKQSWNKMMNNSLKQVFDTLQQELVFCYQSLVISLKDSRNFHIKSHEFIENGQLLFRDDYEQHSKSFKKMLFEKICASLN